MKTVTKYERQVTCKKCQTLLVYDGRDLRWGDNEGYYYVECPICGEKTYIKINEDLKQVYDLAHNPYGNTSYEDLARERV